MNILSEFYLLIQNRSIGPKGREVLNKLLPLLIYHFIANQDLPEVASRAFNVLKKIITRTAYLQLLLESHKALMNFILLCRSSSLIPKRLARYPHLLGELLDSKTLFQPLELADYINELKLFMLRTNPGDEEDKLNALCQFKQIQQLRIASADVSGKLPTMKVSDHLTELAEVIFQEIVLMAKFDIIKKYGLPSYLNEGDEIPLCVVAYGKLAGWELGYRSDLDIIFLTDDIQSGYTNGNRSIDNQLFFQRLGQRIIHLLSVRTNSGLLYEIDTRLRPRGESGSLINTFKAFEYYQMNEAWTYEHQALVRSRVIGSSISHQNLFMVIRHKILSLVRDVSLLRKDVISMREKMLANMEKNPQENFDLKQARFGIIDIEFIAQFLVLAYAHKSAALTVWPDNIRIFEALVNEKLIDANDGLELSETYIAMRNRIHHLSLNDKPGIESKELIQQKIDIVKSQWQKWLSYEK